MYGPHTCTAAGGELCVGEDNVFDLSQESIDQRNDRVPWAAFYADVEHEVCMPGVLLMEPAWVVA